MIRTQVQLTEEQHRRLKRWADRLGISMAEAVRRCVELGLAGERVDVPRDLVVREALAVAGAFEDRDGAGDVAREHDAYLAEAYDG